MSTKKLPDEKAATQVYTPAQDGMVQSDNFTSIAQSSHVH